MRSIFVFCFLLIPTLSQATPLDDYNQLLQTHIKAQKKHNIPLNLIDYQALKKSTKLASITTYFTNTNPNKLNKFEKLAFYINAYNFYTIQLMVRNWPINSIKDLGSFFSPVWKKEAVIINHKKMSLNDLEHGILRKLGEPRIHFAIVCASVSCPDIRNEAYRAEKLEQQLQDQTIQFLNNPYKGLKLKSNTLYVSKIFDWFEEDFKKMGGVDAFILQYHPKLKNQFKTIKYLDYDWSANGLFNIHH